MYIKVLLDDGSDVLNTLQEYNIKEYHSNKVRNKRKGERAGNSCD